MFPVDLPDYPYLGALYRRNNFGQPCVWYCHKYNFESIIIYHGIVGKTITKEIVRTHRNPNDEANSRIKDKRKSGYKFLYELKDNTTLPVEGELLNYLNTYLPINRTTSDDSLLPMLAKAYDNTNDKLFKKCSMYYGQYKINGLRCFISAEKTSYDMFNPIHLRFQSREGTYWDSLYNLEDYLLDRLNYKLVNKMIEEHYVLDGELYLPGYTVNEINHFVKDKSCKENKLIQFWCYDLAIENATQDSRIQILHSELNDYLKCFNDKNEHLNNTERLVVLGNEFIVDGNIATSRRDFYIELGFEGLIMRNPSSEYQYGKRNLTMIKYKKSTDGKFTIIDIYPEGIKRPDIPLFLLQNDINNSTFEVHLSASMDFQRYVLKHKEDYIGKKMYVEYGERSGVNEVPFHVKETGIIT